MERLSALLLALCASSCISATWIRERIDEAPQPVDLQRLAPGDDLERCLAVLGAPLFVFEWKESGLGLAWAWRHEDQKGFRISAPVFRAARLTFDYADRSRDLPGVVLFFDERWKLARLQSGFLKSLVPAKRTPRAIDEG